MCCYYITMIKKGTLTHRVPSHIFLSLEVKYLFGSILKSKKINSMNINVMN